MKQLVLKDILKHIGGDIIRGHDNTLIKRVTANPKKIKEHTLYFHLGNKEIDLYTGIPDKSVIIVTDKPAHFSNTTFNGSIVKVEDITSSYWSFVRYYRSLFKIPVIGVTGTCGKTTITEMLKTILSAEYRVTSTYDGYNGWYRSLPYLTTINNRTRAAVFEMGVGKPGDLTFMCKHYQPQVGILTNIGTYHLEGCKTLDNYIKAKAELLKGIGNKGTLILNADDANIKKIDLTPFKGTIIYFGMKNSAQFKAKNIKYAKDGMSFTLLYQNKAYPVIVPGFGEHNVYNALAAIAACHSIGISMNKAVARLAAFKNVRQHMQIRKGINNCTIIDDTWNCTPLSTESGLEVLKNIGSSKVTAAVLGHMPRLGTAGISEYDKIGKKVAESGIDYLILVGGKAGQIGKAAVEHGFEKRKVFSCLTADQLLEKLTELANPQSVILFKFPYKYRLSNLPEYRNFMAKIFKQ